MSDQKSLGREGILASKSNLVTETITTEAWGDVRIRQLSYGATKVVRPFNGTPDFELAYFVASVVDENDAPMFTVDDIPELGETPMAAITEVVRAALKLNGALEDKAVKN